MGTHYGVLGGGGGGGKGCAQRKSVNHPSKHTLFSGKRGKFAQQWGLKCVYINRGGNPVNAISNGNKRKN